MERNKKTDFIYLKIYQDLKEKIENNQLKQGEKLKTEKQLQAYYNVSRDTLRKALSKLEQDQFITRRAAVGTFVKWVKSDYQLSVMESFSEQMRKRGIEPASELVSIELLAHLPKDIAKELQIQPEEKCYKICRIRKGDGAPMAFETAYVSQALCPNLQQHIHDQASLYDIYERIYGHVLQYGTIHLEAEMPSQNIQEHLKIGKNAPVLRMRCTLFLQNEKPLYYVECSYIGEKYVFSAKIPR